MRLEPSEAVAESPSRVFARRWDPASARLARRGVAAATDLLRPAWLWVALAVALAIAIRLLYVSHPLAWDEARVMLSLRELVERGRFNEYWFIHGPLFMIAAAPVAFLTKATPVPISALSLVFSLGVVVLTYLLAREIFDSDTGVLAAFAVAAMPVNAVFSTWVKQDSLMTLLILWSLLLFVRGRWLWAAAPMSLAILSKEYAALLLPAMFFWAVLTFQWDKTWRWLVTGTVAVATSAWYVLLFGNSNSKFVEGFFGIGPEAMGFGRPWFHYFRVAPADLGWGVTVLAVVGIAYTLWRWRRDDFGPMIVLSWAGFLYLVHSVSTVKGQWYLYYATPAVAMLAAAGGVLLVRLATGRRGLSMAIAVAVIAAIALPRIGADYRDYTWGESYFPFYDGGREVGLLLRGIATPDDRVAFSTIEDVVAKYYSGLPQGNFATIPTTALADVLRMAGVEIPYRGEERRFRYWLTRYRPRWVLITEIDGYPAEYEVVRTDGRIVWRRDKWVLADVSALWGDDEQ